RLRGRALSGALGRDVPNARARRDARVVVGVVAEGRVRAGHDVALRAARAALEEVVAALGRVRQGALFAGRPAVVRARPRAQRLDVRRQRLGDARDRDLLAAEGEREPLGVAAVVLDATVDRAVLELRLGVVGRVQLREDVHAVLVRGVAALLDD